MYEEIIEKIIQEVDIVEYVSNFVDLEDRSSDFFGLCPFHNETDKSFTINKDTKLWYCFGENIGGSVVQFCQRFHKISFQESLKKLMQYGDIKDSMIYEPPEIIKYLKKKRRLSTKKKDFTNTILSSSEIDKFAELKTNNKWTSEEKIPISTLKQHRVKFDNSGNRIVYPIYDIEGNIINIKGRTMHENFKQLGIRKYTYYHKLGTLNFLFNLDKNKHIVHDDEIIIFESAKSVMKLESFGWRNAISIEGSNMSDSQKNILLTLKPKDVIIALDKGISLDKIRSEFRGIARFMNFYIIYDSKGIIREKNSPIDEGIEKFRALYDSKIKF